MAIFEKFGKSFRDIYELKRGFITENRSYVERQQVIARLYASQPPRVRCKICEGPLGDPDFFKLEVGYAFCSRCGHLNGVHEDTRAFCTELYERDLSGYSTVYGSSDRELYRQRVEKIYAPKAEFLARTLSASGLELGALSVADFGTGAGYFLSALEERGHRQAIGYDVDSVHVRRGMEFLGKDRVRTIDSSEDVACIRTIQAEVLCFVSVFEHVPNPLELMRAACENPHIKYVFLVVPMASPSLFVELGFADVYHRQLSGGHTHLFTHGSLEWLAREFSLERIGEWWFGTDMMDFARAIFVQLDTKHDEAAKLRELWQGMIFDFLDTAQLAIDREKRSSQVHLVFRKASGAPA